MQLSQVAIAGGNALSEVEPLVNKSLTCFPA